MHKRQVSNQRRILPGLCDKPDRCFQRIVRVDAFQYFNWLVAQCRCQYLCRLFSAQLAAVEKLLWRYAGLFGKVCQPLYIGPALFGEWPLGVDILIDRKPVLYQIEFHGR